MAKQCEICLERDICRDWARKFRETLDEKFADKGDPSSHLAQWVTGLKEEQMIFLARRVSIDIQNVSTRQIYNIWESLLEKEYHSAEKDDKELRKNLLFWRRDLAHVVSKSENQRKFWRNDEGEITLKREDGKALARDLFTDERFQELEEKLAGEEGPPEPLLIPLWNLVTKFTYLIHDRKDFEKFLEFMKTIVVFHGFNNNYLEMTGLLE